METRPATLTRGLPARARGWLAAIAGLAVVLAWLYGQLYGLLLIAGAGGAALTLAAFRHPMLLVVVLWLIAPFNYGRLVGPAVIKLSELVIGLMVVVAMLRLAAGDASAWQRVRRGWHLLVMLSLLGLLAVATAWPHPNFFNVRYEIQNYIAMAYALLFFQRRHWPLLAALAAAGLAIEAAAALALKYGLGVTGINFAADWGGIQYVWLTADDLASLAGGLFRLAGTFGHKNLLAAWCVMLLPLATFELLRQTHGRPLALAVIGPALVTLALTDSMTGWGAIVLVTAIALMHLRRFDYLAVFGLLLLPVAAFALVRFGDSIFYRIGQLFGGGEEGFGTVSSRMQMLDISRRLISEYFWFGIGRNNYLAYGQTYFNHAHNLALMKLIEMGVPAGLMFIAFLTGVLARSWFTLLTRAVPLARQGQYYRYLGVWLGCLGFTAMNMFDYSYANFSLGPIFMLLLGVLLAMAWDAETLED